MNSVKAFFIYVSIGLVIALCYLLIQNNFLLLKQVQNQISTTYKQLTRPTLSFANAVNKASPSVVTIYTQRYQNSIENTNKQRKLVQASLGSGVIITENGLIITNNHVIDNADNILVHLSDGRSASAILVGQDKETDLAVLRIPFRNLQMASIHLNQDLQVGDIVLAIGNPLNIGQTVTMGIISATGRNRVGINTYENFIQTDASINPGNSGGALINASGDLIGINTAIFSQSGGSNGIGFAIPMKLALDITQQLVENGRISRGWFGVVGVESDAKDPDNLDKGVLITDVFENSPAYQAGIRSKDVITQINQQKIRSIRDVVDQVATFTPGSHVQVMVQRIAKNMTFDLLITERPIE